MYNYDIIWVNNLTKFIMWDLGHSFVKKWGPHIWNRDILMISDKDGAVLVLSHFVILRPKSGIGLGGNEDGWRGYVLWKKKLAPWLFSFGKDEKVVFAYSDISGYYQTSLTNVLPADLCFQMRKSIQTLYEVHFIGLLCL